MDCYQELIVDAGRKALRSNLQYRLEIRRRAESDPKFRRAVMEACRRDVLYWFNAFCWLHEPRPMRDENGDPLPDVLPFITWPHQDEVIRKVRQALGYEDIGIEKSRGEGMSWIAVLLALHDWVFAVPGERMVSIGIVSRTMDVGDNPDDMSSLGAKIDWELKQLPEWMAGARDVDWKRNLTNHTWRNLNNNSLIVAYAATGEVGSGARMTYWIVDELSKFRPGADREAMTSIQPTTHSRLLIGTPYGAQGSYYDVMHEPSAMIKLVLDWKDNPVRNRGLYHFVNGLPVAVDPVNNPLPPHYDPPNQATLDLFSRLRRKGYRIEKGLRSPWYDHECDRADATPYTIAQELDRDYGGSLYKIFTDEFFQQARTSVCRPYCQVDVDFDEQQNPTVTRDASGSLLLWMTLDTHNRPPKHPYVLGVDVSTGLGGSFTSNSVISIIDALTMEQAGELASNTIEPADLADLTVAICKWLGDAYLAWEKNGPGNAFSMRVKQLRYPNIYYRTKIFEQKRRKTKEAGWWTDDRTKEVLFSEMKRVISTGEVQARSDAMVKECHQYIRVGRQILCTEDTRGRDEGDTGEAHGDRVVAFGVAVQALRDRPAHVARLASAEDAQPGSIEERDLLHRANKEIEEDDWDDRANWDIAFGGRGSLVG